MFLITWIPLQTGVFIIIIFDGGIGIINDEFPKQNDENNLQRDENRNMERFSPSRRKREFLLRHFGQKLFFSVEKEKKEKKNRSDT